MTVNLCAGVGLNGSMFHAPAAVAAVCCEHSIFSDRVLSHRETGATQRQPDIESDKYVSFVRRRAARKAREREEKARRGVALLACFETRARCVKGQSASASSIKLRMNARLPFSVGFAHATRVQKKTQHAYIQHQVSEKRSKATNTKSNMFLSSLNWHKRGLALANSA